MARSRRRTSRRTTSQRAAGLIALALPAPVQRVADTRLGSLIMLVGVPTMIVFGLLNVTWVDGFPTFTINRNKATELRNAASQQLNNLEHQAAVQNWGQPAVELLHAAQGPNHAHYAPGLPSTQSQAPSQAYDWQQQQFRQQQSYQPQAYQPQAHQQQHPQQQNPQQPYSQQPYSQQQYSQQPYSQQPYPQQPYPQQPYSQQQYSQQQWPTYGGQQVNPYGTLSAQPSSFPNQPYNNGFALPSTSNSGLSPYASQGGQLLRH